MGVVHLPNPKLMKQAGFGTLSQVPVAFLDGNLYPRELNQFIRARTLGDWHPTLQPRIVREAFGGDVPTLHIKSAVHIARHLLNFVEWADWAKRDWRTIRYIDLVNGYQADMQKGRWSASGNGLRPSTINYRVSIACQFLTWAAIVGYREPFQQSRIRMRTPNRQQGSRSTRTGHVRQAPAELRIPKADEVARWLTQVRARFGVTKALMCELVIKTGLRRAEVVMWPTRHLSGDPSTWRWVGGQVILKIREGTKYDAERHIRIDGAFALKLSRYRELGRLKALARRIDRTGDHYDPPQLFLSEHNGEPISYQSFYDAWSGVPNLPYTGWSPHLGRHYWACTTLLAYIEKQASLSALAMSQISSAWTDDFGRTAIQTIIQPQLGHCSEQTCGIYLSWLHHATALTDQYLDYHSYLDGEAAA